MGINKDLIHKKLRDTIKRNFIVKEIKWKRIKAATRKDISKIQKIFVSLRKQMVTLNFKTKRKITILTQAYSPKCQGSKKKEVINFMNLHLEYSNPFIID